jgi:hypothetical protein
MPIKLHCQYQFLLLLWIPHLRGMNATPSGIDAGTNEGIGPQQYLKFPGRKCT